jgi:hypothetical protein
MDTTTLVIVGFVLQVLAYFLVALLFVRVAAQVVTRVVLRELRRKHD